MKKEIDLCEKFLLSISPPQAKQPLQAVFAELRLNPIPTVLRGWEYINPQLKQNGTEASVSAVNGLVLGVSLYYALLRSPDMTRVLEGFLESQAKENGENVIDFLQSRVGRIKK